MTFTNNSKNRGMALVLVLSILVLICGLALAIFNNSQGERASSSLFAKSYEAQALADTSVNLCIAQIADATTATNRIWVSQPGLIRTFTGNRQPAVNYRLYSWADMRPSGAFDPFSNENAVPPDWKSKKALFVDLNAPVPDPNDPKNTARDHYPILYPPARTSSSSGDVAGYEVPAPGESIPGGGTDNPVPMPVQWLYVLEDGSVKEAVEVSATKVTVAGATSDNPIVGRIAFWADDDSSKVNINTASGGLFWAPPWFETPKEHSKIANPYGFGISQPVRNEFQRYPGHPARTDLQAVFPELSWDDIYILTPRVIRGGSDNGKNPNLANVLAPDNDRLFASLGELRFASRKTTAAALRKENGSLFGYSISDEGWTDLVERRKGFLTTSSRAPELTMSGKPRVAVWPISVLDHPTTPYRSALDKLIAFCATLKNGGAEYPFYFTRMAGNGTGANTNSAFSETADITRARNEELYRYLRSETDNPVPGLSGSSFSAKYGQRGRDQILTEIFDYIRCTNLDDMLLSLNRRFTSMGVVVPTRWDPGAGETRGFGRTFSIRQVGFQFICTADGAKKSDGTNNASNVDGNLSLDPFPEGELAENQRRIQALLITELFSPSAGYKMIYTGGGGTVYISMRVKGLGSMTVRSKLPDGTWSAPVNLQFPDGDPAPQTNSFNVDTSSFAGGYGNTGGAMNWRFIYMRGYSSNVYDMRETGRLKVKKQQDPNGDDTETDETTFPYVSLPVTLTIDPANPEMEISGGTMTVDIYARPKNTTDNFLINSVTVNFDPVVLPVPRLHPDSMFWAFHKKGIFGNEAPVGRFGGKDADTPSTPLVCLLDKPNTPAIEPSMISEYDTVQTYMLAHGDSRMLFEPDGATQHFVPAPSGDYSNLRHILGEMGSVPLGQYAGATLSDASVSWKDHWRPVLLPKASYPSGINGPWTFGDWDISSPLMLTDGPLINKPDEGNFDSAQINPYTREIAAYNTVSNATHGTVYHTANRQIPSAIMFGSLPTGLISGDPWQTLLFRPAPSGHPGANDPPDHQLLDLFWMPVVEPYAISEPFSTAGKINMNFQMIPFTYIERSTGLHAVLMNEQVVAVPETGWTNGFGKLWTATSGQTDEFSHPIDVDQTLTPFRSKFNAGEVFLTPSEITEVQLVPEGETYAGMPAFWNSHRLTGENIRERSYANIYPRLTTKSNVFDVHYWVEVLRKKPDSKPEEWDEEKDKVVARARGNTVIERYIDMNLPALDYANPANASASAESLYRFRILSNKEFNP